MTCCSDTARNVGKLVAPEWNGRTMRKNRLNLTSEPGLSALSRLFSASCSYLYVGIAPKEAHECLVFRIGDHYVVYDSYINYRGPSARLYDSGTFRTYMKGITMGDTVSMINLFHPPKEVVEACPDAGAGLAGWVSLLK